MRKDPDIIDAEFFVVGENRWQPFRRWLEPRVEPFVVWLFQTAAAVGLILFGKFVLFPSVLVWLG